MCTSIYEISRESNSLKLVKGKPEWLPYCHRAVCVPYLAEQKNEVVGWELGPSARSEFIL